MEQKEDFLYKFVKPIYVVLLKLIYRPEVKGIENIPKEGAVIFVGNHRCAFDPIMVMACTNRVVHYMAKKELFKGLHGWIFKKIGLIPINRAKSNPSAVIEAEKILESGGTIGIFPEGTRNRTNQELLPFKKGAVAIAIKTNSKVVPFAIKGKYRVLKKGLVIEFGKPVEILNQEKDEANKELEKEVLKLIRK